MALAVQFLQGGEAQSRLDAKIDGLRADFRDFYRTLGQHDARLDALERDRKS